MNTRYCPSCRDERRMEQPPCEDGHDDCPEWSCVDCGAAIVMGWIGDEQAPRRSAHSAA